MLTCFVLTALHADMYTFWYYCTYLLFVLYLFWPTALHCSGCILLNLYWTPTHRKNVYNEYVNVSNIDI